MTPAKCKQVYSAGSPMLMSRTEWQRSGRPTWAESQSYFHAVAHEHHLVFAQTVPRCTLNRLAEWLIIAGHRRLTGFYNAVGSERELLTVLLTAARVAGHTGELISADDEWLTAHDVNYWAGPRSLPLWLPTSETAFARRSRNRFLAAGGTERDLKETLVDVLADERTRGLGRERRAGLTRDEEVLLLDEISG